MIKYIIEKIRAYIKLTKYENKLLLSSIDRFYLNTNHAFNAKEVADYANSSLNKNYPLYFIRRFMKSEINLRYKRLKPRLVSWNFEKLKHVRLLFAVEFWKRIKPETLIISIDESSINQHIQRNNSWSSKGCPWEAINSFYSASISMWFGIWYNGTWVYLITYETIDSEKFFTVYWVCWLLVKIK